MIQMINLCLICLFQTKYMKEIHNFEEHVIIADDYFGNDSQTVYFETVPLSDLYSRQNVLT